MADIEKVIKKGERILTSTVDRNMIDSFVVDALELLKEQKAEYPVCEKCGKEIDHINTSVFSYEGLDSVRSIPITYIKENECVSFSINKNWTGYDLIEEERKDRICCPYCGKFPFNNSTKIEVHIPLTVDVMMWISKDGDGE